MSSGASPSARSGTPRAPFKLSYAIPYGLTHELGSVPLCSLRDTPSSLKLSYATAKLQFTKLRNFKNPLGRGKILSGHQSGAMSSPWAVTAPRALQTNSTQWIGYLSPGQGLNSPLDLALVGYLNLLAYQVQINFTIILQLTQ